METGQIILFLFLILLAIIVLKRIWLVKSIKHYSPEAASEKLKNNRNTILLDVRTKDERKAQSIKSSFHIPLPEIASHTDDLKKFKDKEIICYCRSGNRSLTAASKLRKRGFKVANLRGGIIQWNSAGI